MTKDTQKPTKQTKKTRKIADRLGWVLFLLALIGIAILVILEITKPLNPTRPEQDDSIYETSADGEFETGKPNLDSGEDKTPIQNEGEDPNDLDHITGAITYADVVANKLTIRVNIDQFLGSTGTCILTLTHSDGTELARTASTIDNPNSASCEGFDIPTSSLATGDWKITVDVSASSKTGHFESEVSL